MEDHALVDYSLGYFALVFAISAVKIAIRHSHLLKITKFLGLLVLFLVLLILCVLFGDWHLSSMLPCQEWARQVFIVKLLDTLSVSLRIVEDLDNLSRCLLHNVDQIHVFILPIVYQSRYFSPQKLVLFRCLCKIP